ncbi:MAG: hypothetical protein FD165_73 [Gammaproteobacteria bacterium]|nr:MAG: hypothetical protein FD165_73 [Gammaproteobacteria bacterium]TND06651.1 MAG: hypothetical protein FD120_383 [Gammaproteobacteria bacterium]
MKLQDVQKIARSTGVKAGKLDKTALIRAIQQGEGNFDCFGTAHSGYCDQTACLWREDCLTDAGAALSA